MNTKLIEIIEGAMAVRPAPTAADIVELVTAQFYLVAEAAGVVEWEPEGDPMGPGKMVITDLGLAWVASCWVGRAADDIEWSC